MISCKLREFFLKDNNNCIKFWDCPSKQNWLLHSLVDKDSKSFDSQPIFPCKLSWDYCKKHECNSILSQWKISFQVSDLKGRNFLELLDSDQNPIELSTINYFNSLCTRATRAIVNHTPTSEYHLKFSLGKNSCVHVVYIQLNLGDISCMTTRDSTTIGILEGIL